jgi:hypothetical protein
MRALVVVASLAPWMVLNAALPAAVSPVEPTIVSAALPWQQLSPALNFTLIVERERYTTLDRSARLVFAVETGKGGPGLAALAVDWAVRSGDRVVVRKQDKIEQGLLSLDIELASLPEGRYEVTARLMSGEQELTNQAAFFRLEKVEAPAQAGRIALVLPAGQPLKDSTFPVQAGVPFPKGALWNTDHVRLVDAQGKSVPCGLTVRGRWGSGEASIRWLGVDFQPAPAQPWWPACAAPSHFLEFGPTVNPAAAPVKVTAVDQADGIAVDAGAISFLVRRKGFNLIDEVKLNGKSMLKSDATQGLYLIDHEGATYRAANDTRVKLTIEEQNDLRVVVRAEGWYVKDGTAGEKQSFTLPTDKLCKFITRIEAYAGKPYVRVLSTWINTFDTFTVRLRDMGLSLPLAARRASFGVEGKAPVEAKVPAGGVRLVQHLHDQFVVEDGAGKALAAGARSAGWVVARGKAASVAISHRNTWQRFPKEIEVLPDAIRLHVWPAHGKDHPEINPLAKDQIHRLWYAHQGRELNMTMPWGYYFAVSKYAKMDQYGDGAPQAFAGVQTCGMGTAVTSDLLVHFAASDEAQSLPASAECFQAAPHALADPPWTCDSLALGYLHPYDPENFRGFEETIFDSMRGYWESQDAGRMFGMWIYRSWQHSSYNGDGSWVHYRLFNGSHHGEAAMPWTFYARSGDPFYLAQGRDNLRQLSDVQIVHHADRDYEKARALYPSQLKLVGATFHDNCVAPWGGDSEVFGHQPCYNGLILGYYLTGDLRLREVLAEEWQKTITESRDRTPAGDCASAVSQGRDNSNPLSDLIDLYQLTYDARVLALIRPRLDVWLYGNPAIGGSALYSYWGHPLHNVSLFMGVDAVRQSLLKGVAEHRAGKMPPRSVYNSGGMYIGDTNLPPGGKPRAGGYLWDYGDYDRSAESYSMAGIFDPQSTFAADAMAGWSRARTTGQQLARGASMPFTQIADNLRPMPRLMYALMHSTRRELAGVLGDAQPMPTTWAESPFRGVVREDRDQEIKIHIIGTVRQTNGVEVQAFGPDSLLISRTTVPFGRHSSYAITLPKDGRTGQYVLLVKRGSANHNDDLSLPLTALPEVFVAKEWITGDDKYGACPAQYFTRSPGAEPCEIAISGERTKVFASDRRTLLGFTDKEKKSDAIRVGPEGALICGFGAGVVNRYTADDSPVVFSVNAGRWFVPEPAALALQPVP